MANDHLDNIVINISLDPAGATGADFFFPMIIADEANGTTLDGDRVRTYSDTLAISTDETAGFLSTFIADNLRAGLSQQPFPQKLKVGKKTAVESYSDALTAIRLVDDLFYTTDIESRVDADLLVISGAIEPVKRKLAVIQSDEATFLTTGFPAGLTAIDGRERTAISWHDDDTEPMAFAWAASVLAFDPNVTSAPWDKGVNGVTAISTALTQGQKDFLDANKANVGLELDGAPFFVDAGVNAAKRPLYEMMTLDWFEATLQARVASAKARLSNRGKKWTVDATGQARLLAIVNQLFDQGADPDVGHFIQGAKDFRPVAITSDDLDNQRLRITGPGQFAVSGRLFQFDLNFTRQPLPNV
jgi:hypothetical protein